VLGGFPMLPGRARNDPEVELRSRFDGIVAGRHGRSRNLGEPGPGDADVTALGHEHTTLELGPQRSSGKAGSPERRRRLLKGSDGLVDPIGGIQRRGKQCLGGAALAVAKVGKPKNTPEDRDRLIGTVQLEGTLRSGGTDDEARPRRMSHPPD
jgi:hypothetical protein